MQLGVSDTDVTMIDAIALGAAAALASVAAAAASATTGQQRGWDDARHCPDARLCSCSVLLCTACNDTGAVLTRTHRDVAIKADGHDVCVICSHQIAKRKLGRPHGGGRAHVTCISRSTRAAAADASPIPRTKRPYESLAPTQRWMRRTTIHQAMQFIQYDSTSAFVHRKRSLHV